MPSSAGSLLKIQRKDSGQILVDLVYSELQVAWESDLMEQVSKVMRSHHTMTHSS